MGGRFKQGRKAIYFCNDLNCKDTQGTGGEFLSQLSCLDSYTRQGSKTRVGRATWEIERMDSKNKPSQVRREKNYRELIRKS